MKSLILDFSRHLNTDEPFYRPVGQTVDYTLHMDGGRAEQLRIEWSTELLNELNAIADSDVEPALAQKVGNRLRSLLPQKAWSLAEKSIDEALQAGEPVRITVRSSAEELYMLPWDLLTRESGQYLCAQPGVLLRYSVPKTHSAPESPSPRPEGGRILFAWAAPGSEAPFGQQRLAIQSACSKGGVEFDPQRDVVNRATVTSLTRALSEGPPVNVLHILCHGDIEKKESLTFGLMLHAEESSSTVRMVDARQLEQLLSPFAGQLRLVILTVCNSAHSGRLGNHLGSPALAIFRGGIASVIASRFVLSQDASVRFTQTLYDALLGEPTSLEAAFLRARQVLLPIKTKLAWASLQLYSRPEDGEDSRPVVLRPYRGLLPFEAAHSRFFFGRGAEVSETISDLEKLATGGKPRFLVVAGASGTGKSSVVMGGVVPQLVRAHEAAQEDPALTALSKSLASLETYLQSRPGDEGVAAARSSLQRRLEGLRATVGASWQAEIIRPGAEPLQALEAALDPGRRDSRRRFLLVVDQLEELFTHTADPAVRREFIGRLWKQSASEGGIFCIVTIRVDFLGHCGELVLDEGSRLRLDNVAYDDAHHVFVAQMSSAALRETIEGPARLVGLELESGLAEQLLTDVEGAPGALPLLEYALDLLWQRREGRRLSLAVYHAMGRVIGALERKADTLIDSLSTEEQALARRILVKLVGLGQGGATDTRLRVPIVQLRSREPELAASFDHVVSRLAAERMVVVGGDGKAATLEVAHEALIRKWKRLTDWLAQDRAKLLEVKEMEDLIARCQGRLHGNQIGYARSVLDKHPHEVSESSKQVIVESERLAQAASEALRQQLLATYVEEGRRLLQEGNTAHALMWLHRAYQEGSSSPVLPYLLKDAVRAIDGTEHELGTGAAALSVFFSPDCSRAAILSRSPSGDGTQVLTLCEVSTGKVLATLQNLPDKLAVGLSAAESLLLRVVGDTAELVDIPTQTSKLLIKGDFFGNLLDLRPEAGLFLTSDGNGAAQIWSVRNGELISTLAGVGSGIAALSPDGSCVLITGGMGGAELWNLPTGELRARLVRHLNQITAVRFSPDGSLVATLAGFEEEGCIWEAASGLLTRLLPRAGSRAATFSPDGQRLLTIDGAQTAKLWGVGSGALLMDIVGNGEIRAVGFMGASGFCVARQQPDPKVICRIVTVGQEKVRLGSPGSRASTVSLSSDGREALTTHEGRTARWWNVATGELLRTWENGAIAASFSAAGPLLVVATEADPELWDLAAGKLLTALRGHLGEVHQALFGWDGRRVATYGVDGSIRLWDAATGAQLAVLLQAADILSRVRFSSDGRLIMTQPDTTAKIWDAETGQLLCQLPETEALLCAGSFAAGIRAVTTNSSGIWLWDVRTGQPPSELKGIGTAVVGASFSPDGQLLFAWGEAGKVLDLDSGRLLAAFALLPVEGATFSPDGRRLATDSPDGITCLWVPSTGRRLASLSASQQDMRTRAWSPDSHFLITCPNVDYGDGIPIVWDVGPETRSAAELGELLQQRLPLRFEGSVILSR